VAFHREWHATQDGRGRQYWEPVPDPSLGQLARVVVALEAVRPVAARPEFVADLRARLMAEAVANASTRGAPGAAVAEWGAVSAAWGPTRASIPT